MTNKLLGIFMLVAFFNLMFLTSKAQDSTAVEKKCKIETEFGADLMSRYVWRGLQFGGNTPAIQPALALTMKNFELGFWGSYSLTGANVNQEFDLYLTYTFWDEMFAATITDYFFPVEGADYNYYNYKNDETGHVLEGMLKFNGTEKFPFSIAAAVNFYGADGAKLDSDSSSATFNQRTGIQYSNYFELGYSKELSNSTLDVFAGFTLTNQAAADSLTGFIGEAGYYGSGSGLINVGVKFSKDLKVSSDFTLPVNLQLITNPRDKKVFVVFGMSF